MKVAIVHYWILQMRGGEKVLEALCEMYPDADIFTHVYDPDNVSETIRSHNIFTTCISRLPFAKKLYKLYLPFMPLALELLDLTDYDLIISSESGPAKGIIPGPGATHICYCHSPMRYIWDHYHIYRKSAGFLARLMMPLTSHYLRQWDAVSAARTDVFVANSSHVANRIKKYYRRDAVVIHPPVAVEDFSKVDGNELGDFYLWAGELVAYKRPDILVEAFNQSGKKLVVIGDGPALKQLQGVAKDNIEFLGKVDFDTLKWHFARCKALIFPGEEDFGIIPVEVLASGRPVIGLAKGGLLDIVGNQEVGQLFPDESVSSLQHSIDLFEHDSSNFEDRCVDRSKKFTKDIFVREFSEVVKKAMS
jgi:glycosyltransferase involved in cell wall biosynthesis